jgi:hypothetical protein
VKSDIDDDVKLLLFLTNIVQALYGLHIVCKYIREQPGIHPYHSL